MRACHELGYSVLIRLKSHRKLYRVAVRRHKRGAPPKDGPLFQGKRPETHGSADEVCSEQYPSATSVQISRSRHLHFQQDRELDLSAICVEREAAKGSQRDPRVSWFVMLDAVIPLPQVAQQYRRRFSQEHGYRFLKQELLWTRVHVRTPEQFERWCWLVALVLNQLYLARQLGNECTQVEFAIQGKENRKRSYSSVEKFTPSRILITGVTGFVGSYLVEQCRTHYPQAELFGLCNRKMPQTVFPAMKYVQPFKADITQSEEVHRAVAQSQPDLILHLAAQSSVVVSWADPIQTLQINAIGTLHLLDALRLEHLTPRVLLVGSGEQYGMVSPYENPIREEYPLRPLNPYAISKVTQELYGYQYFVAYGLPILRVRSFNHFGPRQSDTFVIASFARRIALIEAGKTEPVLQVGNLQAQRDFLSVEDVVRAYLTVAECGRPGEIYNVGSGQAHSIQEILDHLLALTKISIRVCEDPARMRPLDIPILIADISRLRSHTGWKPSMLFEEALKETLNYWRYVIATTM